MTPTGLTLYRKDRTTGEVCAVVPGPFTPNDTRAAAFGRCLGYNYPHPDALLDQLDTEATESPTHKSGELVTGPAIYWVEDVAE